MLSTVPRCPASSLTQQAPSTMIPGCAIRSTVLRSSGATTQPPSWKKAWAHPMRLDPQVTGNVGLYYCCYRLSLMGWNVMPTARNARGVDIIAYNADGSSFLGIQVKALSKRNPVPLGKSIDGLMGDFWVVISKAASMSPTSFILLPDEVKQLAHRGEANGNVSYWLQPRSYEQAQFSEAWERIGWSGMAALPSAK